jgi:hypothetical protein
MNIIFLDFDGVLNSRPFFANRIAEARIELYETLGEAADSDPANVAELERLVQATGASIVISSSWRHCHRLDELRLWEST